MRRGPGGGLVVAEPDPTASIEAMALYLGFQGIKIDHLRVLREAVELAGVDRVAARASQPEVASRLRAMLHGNQNGTMLTSAAGGLGSRSETSHRLHIELAELSGNPVLALFVRILIRLWARQSEICADKVAASPPPEADGTIAATHQAVVEALLAGDGGLARHRMRRHLELLTEWWQ
jgi:DNA-binding FadR family transcriptional regulator